MKKNLVIIIFLAGFLLVATSGICKTENLIFNGDFEYKKTDKIPAGWKIKTYRGAAAEYGFDDTEKHSGRYSYRVTLKPPGGSFLLYIDNHVENVRPGKKYLVSVWLKAKNLGYSPNFIAPALRLNFRPERLVPVPTIDLMVEMKGISDWKNLTLTTTAPPNGKNITLDFLLTKGTVWIDDIEITEIEAQ